MRLELEDTTRSLNPPSLHHPPEPPKKVPHTVSAHGRSWDDPYHWMRNTDDQDFLHYLKRENDYAEAYMADTCGLRRRLIAEMKGRMPATVATPPEPWGTWEYFQYIPEGKEYPVLCRKPRVQTGLVKTALNYIYALGKEQILLDWNQVAEKYGYVHIGSCRISPDHKFLAYTLDSSGSEFFSLHIKCLQTNRIVYSSSTDKGVVSLAWTGDSRFLGYTICDQTQRPYQVFFHKVGSGEEDFVIFTEHDRKLHLRKVYIIDSANLRTGKSRVRKRVTGVQYFLEHHDGYFYILTNYPTESVELAHNDGYYLARCIAEGSTLNKWEVLLVTEEGTILQDMDMFHDHLVIFLHKEGLPLFCSIDMPIDPNIQGPKKVEEFDPWFFPVPTTLCNVTPGSNHDFMSPVYRAVVSSPVMPDLTVDYDMKKREISILQQDNVKGITENSNPTSTHLKKLDSKNLKTWKDLSEKFHCERRLVTSHDGVSVPLTILFSGSKDINNGAAGILHGYGAYGEVLDKSWCADRLSLLDRGWVMAFADVRGGGGDPSWHQAGTKTNKMNSIYDFAECAKYLVREGFVHQNRLGAIGVSAGGLLVGATINLHPHLFSAAILKVPFLDISNTMLDPSLPLTILDYDEFGDPKVKTEFEAIRSVSPYDNLSPGSCYPPVLVTASFHDSRVGVWEAAKWVAKARDITCTSCSSSIILKTNMTSGHFGQGGRYLQCEDTALEYAFLIKALGE
ncbi:Prolyl oligopeptidase family protein [Rhynchospora pubera]|uniref:Prolyl endopeptidase n=1 Tax=Rhynchospora pubera TaxID=906938 RepID=A0AAV8BYP4_9POAL|nr:Prolyl oligopeptidase family protein [Rhynchospora pubera]